MEVFCEVFEKIKAPKKEKNIRTKEVLISYIIIILGDNISIVL